jgi:hypothetical protein
MGTMTSRLTDQDSGPTPITFRNEGCNLLLRLGRYLDLLPALPTIERVVLLSISQLGRAQTIHSGVDP